MAFFKTKKIIYYLPSLLWMGFIFFLSSRSTAAVPGGYWQRFAILKTFHLIEYSILYILLYLSNKSVKKSVTIAYLYAITDELHQSFVPGRECRFRDTLIDLLGISLGYLLVLFLRRFKPINRYL